MKLSCYAAFFAGIVACSSTSNAFQIVGQQPSSRTSSGLFAVNNNVVLRPSENVAEFDSLKIGGCRVHRYARDDDPDSETEYIMWYHGRSEEQDKDKTLPPLSTGRIGRATSKNGLVIHHPSLLARTD